MVKKRAVVAGLALFVGLMLLPGFVLSWLGLTQASGIAGLAGITVLLSSLLADRRVAVALVLPLAVACSIAMLASDRPWLAAALMAVCSGAAGLTARQGFSSAVTMAPITVGFVIADPPSLEVSDRPLAVGLVILVTGLCTAGIGWLLAGRVHRPSLQGASAPRAEAYAIVLAVLTGAAGWCVAEWRLGHAGAWLILTLLVVIQPYLQDGWSRTLSRVAGTVLGFIIAVTCSPLAQWHSAAYLVAAVALTTALVARSLHRPYWLYATFLTVAIVFIEGSSGSITGTAWERLIATLVGSLVALTAMAFLEPLYRRSASAHGATHY